MSFEKLVDDFKKKNQEFPQYILDEVLEYTPKSVSDSTFKKILNNIAEEYENSLISPNEAIGVITAQSVGAEATQMTLNTFHFAGIASQSVQGLPRLIEILDARKNLDTSYMKIYLNKNIKTEKDFKFVANKIKETKLFEFVTNVDVDIEEKKVVIQLDIKKLKKFEIDLE